MRTLVVAHGFPPAAQGGSEIYAYEHARTLRRLHGDTIHVLTREADAARPEFVVRVEECDGLTIHWINNTFRTARTFEDTYRNDEIGRIAERVMDELEPDVAHIHHLTCLSTTIVESLAVRRIPCFFTLHDYWLMCHRGQLLDTHYRVCEGPEPSGCCNCLGPAAGVPETASAIAPMFRAMQRLLPDAAARRLDVAGKHLAARLSEPEQIDQEALKRLNHMRDVCVKVTRFFAPSHCMRDRFIRFGVPSERITFSPYGFDHAPFRHLQRKDSRRLRLGFLGSLMVSKGADVLLTAVRDLPADAVSVDLVGAYCAYHGDDSYRETISPLLNRPGVTVHAPVGHHQVAKFLESIDVLVVPSIWPENSPLVIREAFLAGVPVVASRIGGIPEMVTEERNGLLFHAGDSQDLARALGRLINDPALLQTLRSNLPPVRTIEDDVEKTREHYKGATGGGGAKGLPTVAAPAAKVRAADAKVHAVVLNFGTPAETLLAVKSLLASRQPLHAVTVVDNSPGNACRDALRSVGAHITYIQNDANLGFSGGMNVGIRRALANGADHVLLVNSDVFVPPDCLDRLLACLGRTPGSGVTGPAILSRSDPGRVATLGISFTPSTGRMWNLKSGADLAEAQLSGDAIVDAVSGCLMLVKRDVFDKVGLLDEDYFFSFEDLDFCLRARKAGFGTVVAGDAFAYHEGGQSIGASSPSRFYFGARNQLLVAERADPTSKGIRWAFRCGSILSLNLVHAALSRGSSCPVRMLAVARGTRDYLAGNFGAGE